MWTTRDHICEVQWPLLGTFAYNLKRLSYENVISVCLEIKLVNNIQTIYHQAPVIMFCNESPVLQQREAELYSPVTLMLVHVKQAHTAEQ